MTNPKPNRISEEAQKELFRLQHHILFCTDYYNSKRDAELDLQKLESKYKYRGTNLCALV